MTAPAFGTTDLLELGSNWEPQGISGQTSGTRATATGDDGDQIASTVHNNIEAGVARYIYVGSETGFAAAFAADSCDVGDIVASSAFSIHGIAIDYSPCAEGKRPQVSFTFRDGPAVALATYITTGLTLPTYVASTPVVPPCFSVTLGDAEVTNAQWALVAQFGEDLDKDGEYLTGQTYGGEETLTLTFTGTPTSITSTGWDQTSGPGSTIGNEQSGTSYDTTSYTFVRGVTRS